MFRGFVCCGRYVWDGVILRFEEWGVVVVNEFVVGGVVVVEYIFV